MVTLILKYEVVTLTEEEEEEEKTQFFTLFRPRPSQILTFTTYSLYTVYM